MCPGLCQNTDNIVVSKTPDRLFCLLRVMADQAAERAAVFRQGDFHTVFDPDLHIRETNCPFSSYIPVLLALGSDTAEEFALLAEKEVPLLIMGYSDLFWILDFEKTDGVLRDFHLIGPVLVEDIATRRMETAISELGISGEEKRLLCLQLSELHILPINHWMDYGLMLHYSLCGERLDSGSFHFVDRKADS